MIQFMLEFNSVKEQPLPLDVPLLVTNGKEFVTCSIWQETEHRLPYRRNPDGPRHYMSSVGFDGYEFDFNFEVEDITHWALLPEDGLDEK